jgi:hypothetical protein
VKTITALAVLAIVLADLFGSKSSVGGPMTDLLISFVAMLIVGIYQAWGRGPIGWVVCTVLSIVGGIAALSLTSTALELTMSAIHFQGRLATSNHPLRYAADIAMPVATVAGSWLAIKVFQKACALIANRRIFRRTH